MTAKRVYPLGATVLAALCAVVLGMASLLSPGLAARVEKMIADVALLAGQAWIMTGTGQADPTIGNYMDLVRIFYLQPVTPWFDGQTTYGDYALNGLTTPEQFCPIVCQSLPVPQLNFGDSLTEGVANLEAAIRPQLEAGDEVTVFGFSQSSVVATLAMHNLLADAPGGDYDPLNLHFVLIGAPNNPISGMLTRLSFPDGFDGNMQHIPFLNIPLGIEPTPTIPFATDVYSTEYDGWAVFPQDPTNLLAVINAIMGIGAVHNAYFDENLSNAIDLGTIGNTNYYMLPTAELPILAPLYGLGDIGRFAADALSPILKTVIDWSYGNPGAPDAGITVNGVDPLGAAGAWAVTATGQLSEDTGAGFLLRMDPLQMLAGLQYAGVQSLTNTINNLLDFAGLGPLSDSFVDTLLSGYNLTLGLDQALLTGWHDLATQWDVLDVLGPDAIFNGAPLISAQPLLDLLGVGFSLINLLDA
ncbi:PE-PPE domain-containing protein [Mycobacterium sp. UM_WGJ]|uniref:PE-PPE domain-containing protein n=1 Tax=Mycobacterium sp. UM_WGJ TaxID=1370120 RepID=UPI001E4697D3|nr:PE-PPE domain-containing protein [Mycobacterium sp. UM_WGJ]